MGVEEVSPCKLCPLPRKTIPTNVKIGDRSVSSYDYTNWKNEIDKNSSRYSTKSKKNWNHGIIKNK